ncbi:unnamed protein product [Urochloa humidicola]
MYEYDSDEDGEGRPCCTMTPECARKITYFFCRLAFLTGVVMIVMVLGFVFLVSLYGILRRVAITVDDATLTRFSLINTPTTAAALAYNLSVALTIHNPNWVMDMDHTEPLQVTYSFDGQQFDRVRVADAGDKLRARRTMVYHLSRSSDMAAFLALGTSGVAEFLKQNATGVFEVEVALIGRLKYTLRMRKCSLEASCPLKLQLTPPGTTPAVMFHEVKCKLTKPGKYC